MLAYARMLLGRKGGGALDTQFVTAGSSGSVLHQSRRVGYVAAGAGVGIAIGSIDDGTSDLYTDAPILTLYWDQGGTDDGTFYFGVSGIQANAGWTQLVCNGATLLRADAAFSNVSNSFWSWPGGGAILTAGAVNTVVFS